MMMYAYLGYFVYLIKICLFLLPRHANLSHPNSTRSKHPTIRFSQNIYFINMVLLLLMTCEWPFLTCGYCHHPDIINGAQALFTSKY